MDWNFTNGGLWPWKMLHRRKNGWQEVFQKPRYILILKGRFCVGMFFSVVFPEKSGFGPWAFSTRGLGLLFGNFLAWSQPVTTTLGLDVNLWKMTKPFVMFRISAFFWHYLFWRWRWLSLFEDGEPFPQQVGDGSETSCPTLSTWLIQKTFISIPKQSKWESATTHLFPTSFFAACWTQRFLVQGLGQPATDRAMPQAGISMLWCCKGLWLATNLLHVFSSCRFAQVLGEIHQQTATASKQWCDLKLLGTWPLLGLHSCLGARRQPQVSMLFFGFEATWFCVASGHTCGLQWTISSKKDLF